MDKPSCWKPIVEDGQEIGAVFKDPQGDQVQLPSRGNQVRSFLERNLDLGLAVLPPTPCWLRRLLRWPY